MLDQVVYPALRKDPANESGTYPIRFRPGGFSFEIETPGGGLHYLVYQVIEELGRVLRDSVESAMLRWWSSSL
jgi:hypothetical protein